MGRNRSTRTARSPVCGVGVPDRRAIGRGSRCRSAGGSIGPPQAQSALHPPRPARQRHRKRMSSPHHGESDGTVATRSPEMYENQCQGRRVLRTARLQNYLRRRRLLPPRVGVMAHLGAKSTIDPEHTRESEGTRSAVAAGRFRTCAPTAGIPGHGSFARG